MKLELRTFSLKLKHKFKIAHDSRDTQKTLIVALNNAIYTGFGEATASLYYNSSVEEMVKLLHKNSALIESYKGEKPEDFWEKTNPF